MNITLETFLVVCPFLFLEGLIDAIGGGGGLISLPAYLIAGLPPHAAVATNKLSSACGTTLATYRFIRNVLVNLKLAIPSVIAAIIGASIGASLSLLLNENDIVTLDKHTYMVVIIAALIIGMYDGFYGPGTGTFLIIAFTIFAKHTICTSPFGIKGLRSILMLYN